MLAKPMKKLHRILVRFFPPGIILEFVDGDGMVDTKSIDLLNLSEGQVYIYNNPDQTLNI